VPEAKNMLQTNGNIEYSIVKKLGQKTGQTEKLYSSFNFGNNIIKPRLLTWRCLISFIPNLSHNIYYN